LCEVCLKEALLKQKNSDIEIKSWKRSHTVCSFLESILLCNHALIVALVVVVAIIIITITITITIIIIIVIIIIIGNS